MKEVRQYLKRLKKYVGSKAEIYKYCLMTELQRNLKLRIINYSNNCIRTFSNRELNRIIHVLNKVIANII